MSYILSAFADEVSPNLDEQFRVCAKHNISFIEMRGVDGKNIADVTPDEARDIRRRLDAHGMSVSSVGSPFGKISVKDDFAPHLEKFKKTLEVAQILGAHRMRVFSFYMPPDEEPDDYFDEVQQRLSKFVKLAKDITLCHENEKGIFGDTPERCMKLFDAFSGGLTSMAGLKLIFDPANFVRCGMRGGDAFDETYQFAIDYFHIKDAFEDGSNCPAGDGIGDVGYILDAFDQQRRGEEFAPPVFLSVEPHLNVFDGLSDLEQHGGQRHVKNGYESNESAFDAAVLALKRVLFQLDFVTIKAGGFEKWIR